MFVFSKGDVSILKPGPIITGGGFSVKNAEGTAVGLGGALDADETMLRHGLLPVCEDWAMYDPSFPRVAPNLDGATTPVELSLHHLDLGKPRDERKLHEALWRENSSPTPGALFRGRAGAFKDAEKVLNEGASANRWRVRAVANLYCYNDKNVLIGAGTCGYAKIAPKGATKGKEAHHRRGLLQAWSGSMELKEGGTVKVTHARLSSTLSVQDFVGTVLRGHELLGFGRQRRYAKRVADFKEDRVPRPDETDSEDGKR